MTPSRCVRCRTKPGTVLVHNVCAGSGDSPDGKGPRVYPLYACGPCAQAINGQAPAHRPRVDRVNDRNQQLLYILTLALLLASLLYGVTR